ncbi:hypothetical protein DRQ33_03335 [bacterium]|nr:MAG: hypothetical protein DRQ33_03335 [bacterium]
MDLLKIGKSFLQYGQPDLALRYLQESVDNNPNDENCWLALGECQIFLNELDKAEYSLSKVVEIDEKNSRALVLLGLIYRETARKKKSLQCFSQIQKLGMPIWEMYMILGSAYLNMNNLDESEEYLIRARELASNNSDIYYFLSILARKKNDESAAEKSIRRAIEIRPDESRYWYQLGSIYRVLKKNMDRAIRFFKTAIELDSERFEVWNDLGITYMELCDYDNARKCLLKSMEIDPYHYRPYYNLACADSLENRPDEAIEYLQKAFELAPARVCKLMAKDEDLHSLWSNPKFVHFFVRHCQEK